MSDLAVLKSVTAGNANLLGLKDLEGIRKGGIAVKGNPVGDIKAVKNVQFVIEKW